MQFISKKKIIAITGSLLIAGAVIYAAQWKWHFWPLKTAGIESELNASVNPPEEEQRVEHQMDSLENGMGADVDEMNTVNNAVGIKEVLAAHLFGQEAAAKKVPNSADSVRKTQQPLELHGIVYIPHHPEQAVALIAQAGGEAKDYKIGEMLQPLPGWKVFLINPDSVQIEHEGTVELLELPASKLKLDNPQASAQFNGSQQSSLPSSPPSILNISFKKVDDGLVLETPETAAALGLNAADKIVSISGYDFADLENDPALLEQLLEQPTIEASIERNGEIVNFDVPKNLLKTWQTAIKPVN
jgi:type II secretory pathway component PulC